MQSGNQGTQFTHYDEWQSMLSTLFHSWGSDTPPEAVWAANEMLDWMETMSGLTIDIRFDEDGENQEEVIAAAETFFKDE